jgi:hypothetical protein
MLNKEKKNLATMKRWLLVLIAAAGIANAQSLSQCQEDSKRLSETVLLIPPALPRTAPQLALTRFESRAGRQAAELPSFSDVTMIRAELPSTNQYGEFELMRYYSAFKGLEFRPINFSGDSFIKSNIILRFLRAEADQIREAKGADSAISLRNYKFQYKAASQIDGQTVYVFDVKPRHKQTGLFKGRIYVDVFSGSLRRAEGAFVKSPSFWVKKIQFVQDYQDFGDLTFAVHVRSLVNTRILGRVVVDISHRNLHVARLPMEPVAPLPNAASPSQCESMKSALVRPF